ncbi:serine hydrolase [Stigmatella aurantiaca]|uniref:beta-lactamase n=1 Tax=Stigmatella aurantiaca (strain DW4/3-1) TaxID=378806 RepID=Q093K8_STIAD|nr:serine hydrolase [Stigmatella aurantiaca]ADO72707.1 uncharacterized protein STAUR_4929 [Stigmatella aurantiaca DW4/3-1]EAU66947.1 hypothetical protein STIAU_0090 [Stigmatella aurantiaca DW4/3-1]
MSSLCSRRLAALTCFSVLFFAACGGPSEGTEALSENEWAQRKDAALGEALNTTPTAWWWAYGQTVDQVSALVSDNGARIVSLQVEQASPLRLTVATVKNTGSHAKGWWWYVGLTSSQLSSVLSTQGARLISLDAYEVSGQTYFAAVMIPNTGADAKGWWWYSGVTPAQLSTYLTQNSARLVDLRSYDTSAGTRYVAVMVSNTGADAKGWWWYYGITGSQLSTALSQNQAFLTSIEPADASGSTFNVIMEQSPGVAWWWYYGVTASQLSARLSQNGARLLDVKTYTSGGVRKFAAILVNNSNAATTRIGELMRDGTDGVTGHYLKQVGGSVQAGLQEGFVFEPASSIKALIALHAMREVDAGRATLNQLVNLYAPTANSSCPSNTITGTETLGNAIYQMLEFSDNQRTKAVINAFGFTAINQTALTVGMASTRLNHYPGCGGPVANALTLDDAGVMYEGIANGSLLTASSRTALYQRMPELAGDFTGIRSKLMTLVDQEAAGFSLSAQEIGQYKSRLITHYKAGGYTLCNGGCLEYLSVAGSAEVPRCTSGLVTNQRYVWGIFIQGASNATAASNTFNSAKVEPLREPIRAALATWATCSP